MVQISTIKVKIDSRLEKDAENLFKLSGLDVSGAISMYLNQAVRTKSLAIKGLTENGFTYAEERRILRALKDSKDRKNLTEFDSAEDMLRD